MKRPFARTSPTPTTDRVLTVDHQRSVLTVKVSEHIVVTAEVNDGQPSALRIHVTGGRHNNYRDALALISWDTVHELREGINILRQEVDAAINRQKGVLHVRHVL